MQSLDPLFARLSRSKFRSRFRLGVKERQYCLEKGAPALNNMRRILSLNVLLRHYRLTTVSKPHARASGFIAQHATATCCRGCLAKWHNIPQGKR